MQASKGSSFWWLLQSPSIIAARGQEWKQMHELLGSSWIHKRQSGPERIELGTDLVDACYVVMVAIHSVHYGFCSCCWQSTIPCLNGFWVILMHSWNLALASWDNLNTHTHTLSYQHTPYTQIRVHEHSDQTTVPGGKTKSLWPSRRPSGPLPFRSWGEGISQGRSHHRKDMLSRLLVTLLHHGNPDYAKSAGSSRTGRTHQR